MVVDALGSTPQAILRRNLAFKNPAVRTLAGSLAGGVVGVRMALKGFDVWSLVGQRVAVSVVGTAAVWAASRWRPGLNISATHFKDLFVFGVYTMGRGVLCFLNRRTGDLFIGTFLGAEPLGYYTIGRRLLLTMNRLFTRTVSTVALPTFSRLQHDHAQIRQALLTYTRMTSLVAFPAFLGAALLAPELVHGLFGETWDKSVPIMRILALVGMAQCVTFFNSPVIIACGKPSWAFAPVLGGALTAIAVYAVAVRGGIIVVAAAHLVHTYAYAPLPLLLTRKLIGLDLAAYLREYRAPLAGSFAMVGAILVAKSLFGSAPDLLTVLAIAVLIGVVVYALRIRLVARSGFGQAFEFLRLALGSRMSQEASPGVFPRRRG